MGDFQTSPSVRRFTTWALALLLIIWSVPALAGGGDVLPPTARPYGFSLTDMARITAYFNTGPRIPGTEPDTPFQILFSPMSGPNPVFTVRPGTMFYLPVVYSDDAPPILGDLPNVTNQRAVANYYFNP